MANLWDDIAKTIREGVDTVVEKTEELTRIGRIKVDILNIKRNIDKNFSELGGRVYHLLVEENKRQVAGDKEVKELLECIKILEKELNAKKAELEGIRTKEEAGPPVGASQPEETPGAAKKPATKKAGPKASSTT